MKIFTLVKTAALVAGAGLILAACSGTAGTSTSTNTGTQTGGAQPAATTQLYAAPSTNPVATAPTPTPVPDSTTNKPPLSTKDDAASINTDLNNTTVSNESFN